MDIQDIKILSKVRNNSDYGNLNKLFEQGYVMQPPCQPYMVDIAAPHILDDRLDKVIGLSKLQCLYDQAVWSEGPVWHPLYRSLIWSDVRNRRTLAWQEDGQVITLFDINHFNNGNAINAQGDLIHCEHGRRAISMTNDNGNSIIVDKYNDKCLNSPNDITIASDGALWFTDPTFGIEKPAEGYPSKSDLNYTGVYRYHLNEGLKLMAICNQPNGIAFNSSETHLFISQTPTDEDEDIGIYRFDYDKNADIENRLSNKIFFAKVDKGIADGFAIDERDWLWSSSSEGIVVFDGIGKKMGVIFTPNIASNCCFERQSSKVKRLFVTSTSSLYMIDLYT